MRRLFLLLALLGLSRLAAAQTAPDTAAVTKATQAVRGWLDLVDQGHFGESWDSAAAMFKTSITKADWERAVLQARGPLEPFGARTLLGANYTRQLPNAPPGEYVIIQYSTEAAGGRRVVETIVPVRDPDGTWRVSGYFVRPK